MKVINITYQVDFSCFHIIFRSNSVFFPQEILGYLRRMRVWFPTVLMSPSTTRSAHASPCLRECPLVFSWIRSFGELPAQQMHNHNMLMIAVLHRTHLNIEDRAQTILNLKQKHVFATCGTLNFENRLIFGEVIPCLSFSVHFFAGAKMARILPTAK